MRLKIIKIHKEQLTKKQLLLQKINKENKIRMMIIDQLSQKIILNKMKMSIMIKIFNYNNVIKVAKENLHRLKLILYKDALNKHRKICKKVF